MEKDIELKGVKLHYDVEGPETGQPVVLMHGWGCDHTTVASIANTLVKGGLRVYNLDLPGHGKSDEPDDVWGVERFTECIEEFIERLGLKNPILIGHSFGGRIAILLSSRHPEVEKIILVDAAGIKPKRKPKYYIKVYSYKAVKHLAKLLGSAGDKLLDRWRSKTGSADYRNSSPRMRAVMSRCVNEDLKHVMPSIKASTLLIWGANDTATPLSDAKTMEKLIPDAGLVSFEGCGHYSFLDNPGQFRAVIKSFLKI